MLTLQIHGLLAAAFWPEAPIRAMSDSSQYQYHEAGLVTKARAVPNRKAAVLSRPSRSLLGDADPQTGTHCRRPRITRCIGF